MANYSKDRRSVIDSMVPSREGDEGFGFVEAAIVVAIISIVAGVAIPAFNCVRRRAISQAAQTTIQQIKNECESNYVYGIDEFTATNPSQYQITSSGNNSCSEGTISLVPSDTTKYPTYLYQFDESLLSYNFKGQTGTSFIACNKLICGEADSNNKINLDYDFVVKDTYRERECSAYVLVDGPTWEDAEANAIKLGGNLVTVNDEEESKWLVQELNLADRPTSTWIGLKKDNDGKWNWSSQYEGNSFINWAATEPNNSDYLGRGEGFAVIRGNGELNDLHNTRLAEAGTGQGIAEIPICN